MIQFLSFLYDVNFNKLMKIKKLSQNNTRKMIFIRYHTIKHLVSLFQTGSRVQYFPVLIQGLKMFWWISYFMLKMNSWLCKWKYNLISEKEASSFFCSDMLSSLEEDEFNSMSLQHVDSLSLKKIYWSIEENHKINLNK
jgi:hypothetical protein